MLPAGVSVVGVYVKLPVFGTFAGWDVSYDA